MARRSRALPSLIRSAVILLALFGGGYFLWSQMKNRTTGDFSGTWTITNTVTKSNYKSYIGEVYVYKMYVIQDGNTIKGEGEQTRYNGKPAKHHYAIAFTDGLVKDDELILTYKMQASREITGQFILRTDTDGDGVLSGVFTSSGADSRGTCEVRIERN